MTPNSALNWIFGPQLIGLIYLLIGAIQYYFPPKRINYIYGYRTLSSQKNQETWDEANRYSAVYLIRAGILLIIAGCVTNKIIITADIPVKTKQMLILFLLMASAIGAALTMIIATEKHLKKKFGDK